MRNLFGKKTLFLFFLVLLSIVFGMLFVDGFVRDAVVSPVKRGKLNDSVTGNVRVLAEKSFELRSQAQAEAIFSILLPLGKPVEVKTNQLLFEMESIDLNRSLRRVLMSKNAHQKRLDVGSEIAVQLEVEEKDLNGVKELSTESGGVALLDLEKKENYVLRLRKQLENERIANYETSEILNLEVERLNEELKKGKILSPIDGTLVSSNVKPGGMVFSGQVLGKLISHGRVIEVSLNEENFAGLESGQKASVSLFAFGSKVFEGEVNRIAATIDPATGRRNLFVNLDSNQSLPVGASGRAEIIKSEKVDALIIPRKALLGDSVLVVKDKLVQIIQVQIGARNLEKVEVLDGLVEGDLVISETPHLFKKAIE